MDVVQRYIRRETAISAVINGVFSVGFFVAVFGLDGPVAVSGIGNYAFDFLPQSFAIGLFAALVPVFLLRSAIRNRNLQPAPLIPSTGKIVRWALISAVASLIVGAAIAIIFGLSDLETLPRWPSLFAKVAYGSALGSIITRRALIANFRVISKTV